MRFVCDSCRAQYNISDDKVGAKGVKVRCKKCGYVILVRKTDGAQAAPDEPATQVLDNPLASLPASTNGVNGHAAEVTDPGVAPKVEEKSLLGGIEDDEIGAVFDQVLITGSNKTAPAPKSDEDVESTRVMDGAALKKLAESALDDDATAVDKKPDGPPLTDWYVAIDEKQTGPLSLDQIKQHWEAGEIGPDSLCWRAGFPDWVPLSERTELAATLAPRPSRPVIVGPSSMPAPSVVTVPVESAFSAGGVSRVVRSEVPVMAAAPSASVEDSSGWKPSAASALASLVKEEMSVLSRPAARKAAPPPPAARPASGGLLDVPPPEPSGPHPSLVAHPEPEPHPELLAETANIRRPPPPGYASYRPTPPPAAPAQSSRTPLYVGLAIGGTLVVGLLVVVVVLLLSKGDAPAQQVAVAPVQAPVAATPRPDLLAGVPPPGAPAQPAAAPAAAVASQPSVAAAAPTPPPTVVARVEPKPAPVEPKPAVRKPRVTSASASTSSDEGEGGEAFAPPPKKTVAARPVADPSEDEFDKAFGSDEEEEEEEEKPAPKKKASTYIPPAPGSVGIPDSLAQSDIMSVVLANRSAIVRCVGEQKKKDSSLSGTLVMRWVIKPSGAVTGVSVQTDEFKGSYMASCISGLVKGWSFPRHRTQGDPVVFPFKF